MPKLSLCENPAFITRVAEWKLSERPEQSSISWLVKPWATEFPEYRKFLTQLHIEHLGLLNRRILKSTIEDLAKAEQFVEGFLAVMIWGYATDPRGPFRTKQVLSQAIATSSIKKAHDALAQGDTQSAFEILETKGPKFLGTAFATKYLYFATPPGIKPAPIILDSLVSEGLKLWGEKEFKPQSTTSKKYIEYLIYMDENAEKLGISSENLEFLVFSETAKLKGNQSWANRIISGDMSTFEIQPWAFLLASEILLRNSNLRIFHSQAGGGQYDSLAILEEEKKTGLKMDLNMAGSIHFLEPDSKHRRYSWEALKSLGVSSFCELLGVEYGWAKDIDLTTASKIAISFRAMADLAIENTKREKLKFRSVFSDNSAYGQSTNSGVFKDFPKAAESLAILPEFQALPKEVWFWVIEIDGVKVGLIDTFSALLYGPNNSVEKLIWPKQTKAGSRT